MRTFFTLATCTLVAWPAYAIEVITDVETLAEVHTIGAEVHTSADSGDPLIGEWPEETEKVKLDLDKGTVRDAVEQIADQAGWGLVFTAPESESSRELTLKLENVSATAALEAVLEGSKLRARLKDDILVVKTTLRGDEPEVARVKVPLGDLEVEVTPGKSRRIHHWSGDDERTAIGGNLVIEPGEHVDGDAVAIGGNLTVSEGASVDGDAVAVGGSVLIKSGAQIDGEAVAVGGQVTVEDGASVEGDRVSVGGSFGTLIASIVGLGIEKPSIPSYLMTFLGALVRIVTLLVLGLLLLSFAPERVHNARAFLEQRPGHSVLAGLAILIGFIPLCILLGITVIGIPLIPIAGLILAAIMVIGMTAFCTWLGDRIPVFKDKKTPIGALFVGLVVLFLVDLIPIIGSTAIMVVAFIAAGATLLSRFGTRKPAPSVPKDVAEAI